MSLLDNATLKCGAFTSVKCHTVIPSLKIARKGKATLFLTPGLWYAYGVDGHVEHDHVAVYQSTTVVFRFLNFIYTKVVDESKARLDIV